MKDHNYLAVDVSKETLQLCAREGESLCLNYDETGMKHIAGLAQKNTVVVFEATGGYERKLREHLWECGISSACVHPHRVRSYARSKGLHAKTDKLDAELILQFASQNQVPPGRDIDPAESQLAALLDRRSQVVEMERQEKQRLDHSSKKMCVWVEKSLRFLKRQREGVEEAIREHVQASPSLNRTVETVSSVKGVGAITAWTIAAYMPELPFLDKNRAVCLAGLAPFNRDSGKKSGKRKIFGGRAKLRKCLYMAAVASTLHNPHIADYYHRLVGRGKPAKCALVAVMRKLLLHIRSLLVHRQHNEEMGENTSDIALA